MSSIPGANSQANINATVRGACKTGSLPHVAPVTVYCGPGPTSMPHRMPAPPKVPQASTAVPRRKRNAPAPKLDPFRVVGGEHRAVALVERALLMVQRRRQAAAARQAATAAAKPAKAARVATGSARAKPAPKAVGVLEGRRAPLARKPAARKPRSAK